jgi:hypothetical protein
MNNKSDHLRPRRPGEISDSVVELNFFLEQLKLQMRIDGPRKMGYLNQALELGGNNELFETFLAVAKSSGINAQASYAKQAVELAIPCGDAQEQFEAFLTAARIPGITDQKSYIQQAISLASNSEARRLRLAKFVTRLPESVRKELLTPAQEA